MKNTLNATQINAEFLHELISNPESVGFTNAALLIITETKADNDPKSMVEMAVVALLKPSDTSFVKSLPSELTTMAAELLNNYLATQSEENQLTLSELH